MIDEQLRATLEWFKVEDFPDVFFVAFLIRCSLSPVTDKIDPLSPCCFPG